MAENPYLGEDEQNPYYDGSEEGGDSVSPQDIKDNDEVDLLSNDTKLVGTIYIKTDGTLWTWNGTEYIQSKSDDIDNVPIVRTHHIEDFEPQSSELNGETPINGDWSTIYLDNGIIEIWVYNGSWSKKYSITRQPRTFHDFRVNELENVSPQSSEHSGIGSIDGDISIVRLRTPNNRIVALEKWIYSGGSWSRLGITYYTATRVKQVGATDYSVIHSNKYTDYIAEATTNDTVIVLPPVSKMKNRVITFKADTISLGKKILIRPQTGETIDNTATDYEMISTSDSVTLLCDGDEWLVTDEKKAPVADRGRSFIVFRSLKLFSCPLSSEITAPLNDGDVCLIVSADYNDKRLHSLEKWRYSGGNWTKIKEIENQPTLVTDTITNSGYTWYWSSSTNMVIASLSGSASGTVTLPPVGLVKDRMYLVKVSALGSGKIILTGDSADKIDGESSIDLDKVNDYIAVVSDGFMWHIISKTSSGGNATLNGASDYIPKYDGVESIYQSNWRIDHNGGLINSSRVPIAHIHVVASKARLILEDARKAGLSTEVQAQLLNFGTNFNQLGGRNDKWRGAWFRIDTRENHSKSELFSVFNQDAYAAEKAVFRVGRFGDVRINGFTALGENHTMIKIHTIEGKTPAREHADSEYNIAPIPSIDKVLSFSGVVDCNDGVTRHFDDSGSGNSHIIANISGTTLKIHTQEFESSNALDCPFRCVIIYKA